MIDVSEKVKIERITPQDTVAFFGYYDISPESPDGSKVLCNISSFSGRMPMLGDDLTIGYYDEDGIFNRIGTTQAWNFQEGCRLQWVDNDRVAYNIIEDRIVKSVIYSISQKQVIVKFDKPIYSINMKNGLSLSYNLYRSRYNYPHTIDMEMTESDSDGIFLQSIETGESKLLLSLKDLALKGQIDPNKTWVEHTVFNPDGDKFFFFYRGELPGNGFFTKFCVSDLAGNINVLSDNGMCSHAGWLDNGRVTAWTRLQSKVNSFQKNGFLQKTGIWNIAVKIYHATIKRPELRQKFTNEAYVVFDTVNGESHKIDNKEFVVDGHETWSRDGRYMLTDTYPDEDNYRNLMLFDYKNNVIFSLGKFFSYPKIGTKEYEDIPGIRCDLHPKWSYQEKHVYFDSTHEGFRGLYRVDITGLKDEDSICGR